MSGSVPPLHVMQGRLLPPWQGRFQAFPAEGWEREIESARIAGVEGIEWIYEVQGEERNPVADRDGERRLRELCARHRVVVESLCADWFMDRPLLRGDAAVGEAKLRWLVGRASALRIRRVVVPFVDRSALCDDDVVGLVDALRRLVPDLERASVELHLETSLGPEAFADLLARIEHPLIRVNYDSGNSAALGYDCAEEFAAYGDRVGSVHVKDRLRGGGTVDLGHGDADLEGVVALLRARRWERPLVLQVARGIEGDELDTTRAHADWIRRLWEASS